MRVPFEIKWKRNGPSFDFAKNDRVLNFTYYIEKFYNKKLKLPKNNTLLIISIDLNIVKENELKNRKTNTKSALEIQAICLGAA